MVVKLEGARNVPKEKVVDNRTAKDKMTDERKAIWQETLSNNIMMHEGLEPLQLPFRITSPEMGKWSSMFDDEVGGKLKLNAKAIKAPGREKFLYVTKQEDVLRGISIQFKRYATHKNYEEWRLKHGGEPTIADAVKLFDQTGADGKLTYLQKSGIDTNTKLKEIY